MRAIGTGVTSEISRPSTLFSPGVAEVLGGAEEGAYPCSVVPLDSGGTGVVAGVVLVVEVVPDLPEDPLGEALPLPLLGEALPLLGEAPPLLGGLLFDPPLLVVTGGVTDCFGGIGWTITSAGAADIPAPPSGPMTVTYTRNVPRAL